MRMLPLIGGEGVRYVVGVRPLTGGGRGRGCPLVGKE